MRWFVTFTNIFPCFAFDNEIIKITEILKIRQNVMADDIAFSYIIMHQNRAQDFHARGRWHTGNG